MQSKSLRRVRAAFVAVFVTLMCTPTMWGVATYVRDLATKPPKPFQTDMTAGVLEAAKQAKAVATDASKTAAPATAPATGPTPKPGKDLLALIRDFPHDYQSGYNANFPTRHGLVRFNNRTRIALFDESPVGAVVVGKNGWLYYNLEWIMEDYENLAPFSADDLDKIEAVQRQRDAWLRARGAHYYVMVAPNSQTIYPENLPDRFHKLTPKSRLDQLEERLVGRPEPGFNLIDPRGVLAEAKAERRAYHKSDTHWNDWGAFTAAGQLLGRIHQDVPDITPDRLEDSVMTILQTRGGDLAGLLSLEYPEDYPSIVPKAPRLAKVTGGTDPQHRLLRGGRLVYETGRPELPTAVVFHDSFFVALMPMLAEHFSKVIFVWNFDFDADLIEREKPDVVILECVERYIYALTLDNPTRVAGK